MSTYQDDIPPRENAPGSSLRLWIMVVAAFVATFFLIRQFSNQRQRGSQANFSWKFIDLDGKPLTLAKYRGKPIFLNVWATWCGPCRQEMPSIAALAKNPKLKKVVFLCVSVDDNVKEVKSYLKHNGDLPMNVVHSPGSPPKVFSTEGIPATFLIAPDGEIIRAEVGSLDWDTPETVAQLENLARD